MSPDFMSLLRRYLKQGNWVYMWYTAITAKIKEMFYDLNKDKIMIPVTTKCNSTMF